MVELNLVVVLNQPLHLHNRFRLDLMLVQQRLRHHRRGGFALDSRRLYVSLIIIYCIVQRLLQLRLRVDGLVGLELFKDVLGKRCGEITLRQQSLELLVTDIYKRKFEVRRGLSMKLRIISVRFV